MSAAAISALERGSRQAPYRSSVDLLADALNVAATERERLHDLAGARRRSRALPSVPESTSSSAPSWLNRMIAREAELNALLSLVRERRLVTVTGSGGSGKTRLSVVAAQSLSDDFHNATYYVDLTKANPGAQVDTLLADALGLTPDRNLDTADVLQSWLKSKRALIVLDNCEHVVSAVSELAARILFVCSSVHFLATSRQPLRVSGEAVFVLPPLARADAIRLFVERANDAGESLAAHESETAIGELCASLDDLPLAIELAAAQVRHLSVEQIMATMSRNPDVLHSVTETHPRRHRTINATIRWSYELLSERQKRLFRILAIFPDTWTLDALPFFSSGSDGGDTFETHASMIDRCFVRVAHAPSQRRYGYLQTIKAFAMEALRTSDDYTAAIAGLSTFGLDVARRCSAGIGTSEEPACLAALDAEYAAIEAALTSSPDAAFGHELVQHLCEYWIIRGQFTSGVRLASEVLRGPREGLAGDVIDATELAFARLMRASGRVAEAYVADSIVLERARARGDEYLAARALGNIASDEFDIGKPETALDLYTTAARALRPFGDSPYLVRTLHGGGIAAALLQRFDESESLLDEAERVALKIGDRRGLAWIAFRRGYVANGRERPRESERQYEESFRLFRDLEDRPGIALCYEAIGTLRIEKQQYVEAARAFLEGIEFSHRLGLVLSMVSMVERVAHIAFVRGKVDAAVTLFASAAERRAEFSRPIEAPTAHDMRDLIELVARSQARSACATLDDLLAETSSVVGSLR
jgi:predicted ATPase